MTNPIFLVNHHIFQGKIAMLSIWNAALEEFQADRDFVLASILNAQGSSPRHVGTRFLVRRDG